LFNNKPACFRPRVYFYVRRIATSFLLWQSYTADMKTVYVDEMFLLNLIIDYFIILATAKLCALPLKRGRFAISAGIGALYSVLILLRPFYFFASPLCKLLFGLIMSLTAFGTDKILKPFLAFLAVSAAFGGAVYAASLLAGDDTDGGLYIKASMRVLILSFAVCYFVLTVVFKRFGKRRAREIHTVKVTLCGRSAEFRALRDTGNSLFDPISNLPVMALGIDEAGKLLSENMLTALRAGVPEFVTASAEDDELRSRFRLVPYSAVGVEMALLPVFRPDGLWIDGREKKDILVGLSSNAVCGDGEFSALI